jgi:beta-phosphoglucomutase-like phosphatase (HAD superfamily)
MINDSERSMVEAMEEVLKKFGIKLSQNIIQRKDGEEYSDYSEVISKAQERIDKINRDAEQLFSETGMSQQEIMDYGNNPNNFSDQEWQAISKVKEACEQYKREVAESMAIIEETVLEEPRKQQRPKESSGKKVRKKGARKKDWLSS